MRRGIGQEMWGGLSGTTLRQNHQPHKHRRWRERVREKGRQQEGARSGWRRVQTEAAPLLRVLHPQLPKGSPPSPAAEGFPERLRQTRAVEAGAAGEGGQQRGHRGTLSLAERLRSRSRCASSRAACCADMASICFSSGFEASEL